MTKILKIALFLLFILLSLFYLKQCFRHQGNILTIIVKLKDEVEVDSDLQNLSEIQFPANYFDSQKKVKYLDTLMPSDVDSDGAFVNKLLRLNQSNFSFLTAIFPKSESSEEQGKPIKKITPLFSNYDDAVKVMNASANNNQTGKYLFTNLFNYIRLEFDESHKGEVESILKKHLYQDAQNGLPANVKLKKVIEYYYYPSHTSVASSATRPRVSVIDYKTILSIPTTDWGTGTGVNILDFDEGVHLDPASRWAATESATPESPHGTMVMGVLFGTGIGLVPDAHAMVVSSQLPLTDSFAQYSQFLHALALSYDDTRHKINYPILLIEVHNVVGVGGNMQKLPLESDPAMFYLIRLGAFGLNLIMPEVAGNNGANLDNFLSGFISIVNTPLIEFNTFLRTKPNITSAQVNASNSTDEERTANSNFLTSFGTTVDWLSIWRRSPSGAILIAGYGSGKVK
jgi:hypothetical protein